MAQMQTLRMRIINWCRSHPVVAYWLLSMLWVSLLYAHALTAGFASYDDGLQIVQNPSLSSLSESLKYFHSAVSFTSDLRGSGGRFYRPLFWLSLAIDEKIWGLNAVAFHSINVLLHWLSGLFLFLLLHRLRISCIISAITSLLWLSLPINSEAVAWVSGRAYCLSASLMLLGMLFADSYLSRPAVKNLIAYALSALCALFSHEQGLLIVAFLLLMTFVKRKSRSRESMMLYGISIVTVVIYLICRHQAGVTGATVSGTITSFGLFFWKYLGWMVLPIYMSFERSTDAPPSGWSCAALIAWLCLAITCTVFIVLRRKITELSIGFAWIVIGLLPFCGLVFIYQGMAERYTYVSSMGFAFLISVSAMTTRMRFRPLVFGLLSFWIVWGIYRLEERITDWSDSIRLYRASLEANPRSASLHYGLGSVFEKRKDFDEADGEYRKALTLQPYHESALVGLGNVKLKTGKPKEAVQFFEAALQIKPDDVKAVINYGTALQSLGEVNAAKKQYQRAITLAPDIDDAYCDLGILLYRNGDVNGAILELISAAKINPSDPIPLFNLAEIYQKIGRADLAARLYARVIQLNPGDADANAALRSLLPNLN
jgi:protein O-mannosyl-transferase